MEEKVKKTDYGYELVWASHPTYTGKILVFEGLNARTDMYLNKTKNKSLFVNSGKFKIRWIETSNGEIKETEFLEGNTFDVPAMLPIQICSLAFNGSIAEVSDNNDDDVYIILQSKNIG